MSGGKKLLTFVVSIRANLHKTMRVGRWQFYDPHGHFFMHIRTNTHHFCDFVYGLIIIDLVYGSAGYFVFVRIQTIYLRSTCVLSLSLSSLKSVSELLISIYFHTPLHSHTFLRMCKWNLYYLLWGFMPPDERPVHWSLCSLKSQQS